MIIQNSKRESLAGNGIVYSEAKQSSEIEEHFSIDKERDGDGSELFLCYSATLL